MLYKKDYVTFLRAAVRVYACMVEWYTRET